MDGSNPINPPPELCGGGSGFLTGAADGVRVVWEEGFLTPPIGGGGGGGGAPPAKGK